MAERGFLWAQVRRKPLSGAGDGSLPRDLINKGKNIFEKGKRSCFSKGEVVTTGAPTYRPREVESQNRSEVTFANLLLTALLHVPSCRSLPLFALAEPLLFYSRSCLSENSVVTAVLFTGLQTERETLINQPGVSLAPCGLTLL